MARPADMEFYERKKHLDDLRVAEIGVDGGGHALEIWFLLQDRIQRLHLVDNYCDGFNSESGETRKQKMLGQFNSREITRVTFHFESSKEAADKFREGYFDYVYIDADHSYESVKEDLEAWYPLVADGGTLGGHDYVIDGVKKAVDDMVAVWKVNLGTGWGGDWWIHK